MIAEYVFSSPSRSLVKTAAATEEAAAGVETGSVLCVYHGVGVQ
jgi:hypothetical protein